ncbi:MAG: tetratricopeptide repeat protein, partial [Mameliella sp.]|nr:tetratricopeptide repeat protein [Phaeodactylibacter sp.]
EQADVYNDISLSYRYQGKYPQAIDNLDAAINIYLTQGEATHPNLYGFFQNMGHCLLLQQSYDAARYYFEKAPEQQPSRQKIGALLNIALTYQQEARYQQALWYNQEAYRLYQSSQIESIPLFLRIQYQMGIAESPNSIAMPLHFDKALNVIPDSSRSSASDYEKIFLWSAKGDFLLTQGQKQQDTSMIRSAIRYFQKAINTIDDLERIPKAEQANLYLKDDFTEVFSSAIQGAAWLFKSSGDSNDLRMAYHYLEKFKAGQLRRKLRELNPPERFQVDPSIIYEKQQRYKRLHAAVSKCRTLEASTFSEDTVLQKAYADLQKAEAEVKAIQKTIKSRYPDYYMWVQTDAIASIDNLQNNISRGETLLNYALLSDHLVVIAIKKDTATLHLQQIEDDFVDKVIVLTQLVSFRPDLQPKPSERATRLTTISYELYQTLIEPLALFLTESCLIIPDETLSFLPFAALLTEPVNSAPHLFKNHPYFGKVTTIRYGSSNTLVRLMEELPSLPNGN